MTGDRISLGATSGVGSLGEKEERAAQLDGREEEGMEEAAPGPIPGSRMWGEGAGENADLRLASSTRFPFARPTTSGG